MDENSRKLNTDLGGARPACEHDGAAQPNAAQSNAAPPSDLAIRIRGVRKRYRLGSISGRTLQADLQSWWARKRGKEDPNLPIGLDDRQFGQYFWALDNINLEIRHGERVGIIGANGAGKSTLLKLLCRITAPTEGEIDIWGRVTSMLEVGTGFHREMTGRENIYMNGAILGMSRAETAKVIDDIIEFSEIAEFIDTPVKRYSSGMFVKLAFSVAAHLNSEIMIMDEVLAVGDMAFQEKCLTRMRRAAEEEGRTVLYVSHNMATIRRLCDRCIVIDKGRVIFDGEPDRAIALYMDHNIGNSGVDIDLEACSHSDTHGTGALRMLRLRLPDRDLPVYEQGQSLRMLLTVEATRPEHHISVRVTLRTDSDVGLGTSWTPAFAVDRPGLYDIRLKLPLEHLTKGVFYASIGLYSRPDNGSMQTIDHITRAFRIELHGTNQWSTNAYGYLELPTMKMDAPVPADE